ncbi:peptidase M76 family-domain-containing protein [Absidia repens]|uniref:Mitochondrial inner membrane protease ATP23 n=1 Tax=Absidia repens TaxID=90262 RepID=A0A1X2IY95_9FUNG|nr:peptidase M76 family-domain-containing protein [Absidia repens]
MTDTTNTAEDTSQKDMKKFERWRKSLQYLTGLGMDETERKAFRNKLDIELEDYQCQQCERWKTNLIKNNPPVRFMMDEMKKIGRDVTKEDFHCMPCDETRSGGFSPDDGILLCQNRLGTKTRQEHTMVHEMVHMYDHHKFKVDWTNLRHHACSEIRAASLSGDCRWSSEIQRGFYTFTKQHQACVKRRAILSVAQNPHCKDKAEAERAVSSVYESCFADTRPFDEIY